MYVEKYIKLVVDCDEPSCKESISVWYGSRAERMNYNPFQLIKEMVEDAQFTEVNEALLCPVCVGRLNAE